jgi:hypothetical protein
MQSPEATNLTFTITVSGLGSFSMLAHLLYDFPVFFYPGTPSQSYTPFQLYNPSLQAFNGYLEVITVGGNVTVPFNITAGAYQITQIALYPGNITSKLVVHGEEREREIERM